MARHAVPGHAVCLSSCSTALLGRSPALLKLMNISPGGHGRTPPETLSKRCRSAVRSRGRSQTVWGSVWSEGRCEWACAPADAFLAADAGAFAALGCENVGVTGVGVAPAQVGVRGPGLDGVVAVVGVGDRELPQWPEVGLGRVGRPVAARRAGRAPQRHDRRFVAPLIQPVERRDELAQLDPVFVNMLFTDELADRQIL